MGISTTFMMAWKPCTESSFQAKAKPMAVSATASAREHARPPPAPSAGVRWMPASGASSQEHRALQPGERRAAEHLAGHDRRARHRRHQHALEEALVAVLDHRDGREDGGEEQHQHDGAGEEILQVAEARRPRRQPERAGEAAADQQPEDERRADRAGDAARLAEEAHQLALPEGEDGEVVIECPVLRRRPRARRPVRRRKTSSRVGRATVTDSIRPGKASARRATSSWPRSRSRRTAPSRTSGASSG